MGAERTDGGGGRLAEGAGTLRIGVLGSGAMGRNHARVLAALPGVELVGLYDPRQEVAAAVAAEHRTRAFPDAEALAAGVDAMVVAGPTVLHAEIGCELLGRGLHVLVEKPLAASLADADRLIAAAAAAGRVLAVGHVEFFNPAVQALLAVGVPPRFVEVQRLAVFTPRSLDVDVVLDLMIHDLQILHALDGSGVAEVRATGIPVLSPRTDIANVRLELGSGCVANLTASRVSAERVRKLRAFLPSRYYSLDYVTQEIRGFRLEVLADGRRIVPAELEIAREEPLRRELEAFAAACRRGADGGGGQAGPLPLVDGAAGRQALATALAVAAAIGSARSARPLARPTLP